MSKILALCFVMFAICPVYAQTDMMVVSFEDGSVLEIPLDSIGYSDFRGDDSPEYQAMHIWSAEIIPNPLSWHCVGIDSLLTSSRNEFGRRLLSVNVSGFSHNFDIQIVDSLTFESFSWNPSIKPIDISAPVPTDVFPVIYWRDKHIFRAGELKRYTLSPELTVVSDSDYGASAIMRSLDFSADGQRILSVSQAGVIEFDQITGSTTTLVTQPLCRGARYLKASDNLVFYSDGSFSIDSLMPEDAGYYFYDRASGKSQLLLSFITPGFGQKRIEGFDISPDNSALLLAGINQSAQSPALYEYSFQTKALVQLPITFDAKGDRYAIWARYSQSGDSILYSNYSTNSFFGPAIQPSETGIANRMTGSKNIIDCAPTNQGQWNCVFPVWSPSEREIAFAVSMLSTEPPGWPIAYSLWLKRLP